MRAARRAWGSRAPAGRAGVSGHLAMRALSRETGACARFAKAPPRRSDAPFPVAASLNRLFSEHVQVAARDARTDFQFPFIPQD
jgi:hypothetical protein